MKNTIIALGLAVAGWISLGSGTASAAICPQTSNTNTDCGYVITIAPDGTLSGAPVAGANPFDGSDDALIGVVNNSSAPLQSLTLSGSGNGGGLFAFDGDGICYYIACSYSNPTTYEGPQNTFSNYDSSGLSGEVDFTGAGLAAGATTYFSLEGSPASINVVVPPTPSVPEPASLALLGLGLFGLGAVRKRFQA